MRTRTVRTEMSWNKTRLNKLFCIVVLCSAWFAVAQLWAQTSTTGELGGTVTDPSGAVVTNAAVTLKNADDRGWERILRRASFRCRRSLYSGNSR